MAIGLSLALVAAAAMGQQLPQPKPTLQGLFFLPVGLHNPVFNNLANVLGQVDLAVQMPFVKGVGLGLGANASFYELNEHALAPEVTEGSTQRLLGYAKLFWAHYTGPRSFVELNAKFGQSRWDWACRTCAINQQQTSFHWGLNAAWFVHASDNLAFGLSLGYQRDGAEFNPEVIGLPRFPGRTDTGAPYQFLTVGLGFSTGFKATKEGIW